MNCKDFRINTAAFALGILDPEDRSLCLEHLNEPLQHPRCMQALQRAQQIASALALAPPASALNPSTWNMIEARLAGSQGAVGLQLEGINEKGA